MGGSRVLIWVAIVLIAAWFLYTVRSILFPFAFGLFTAAILDPSIRKLRLRGFSRPVAVLTMFVGFFILLTVAAALVIPRAISQLAGIQEESSRYLNTILFPPTKLDLFLDDKRIEQKLIQHNYPSKPLEFKAWLRNREKTDENYVDFFTLFGPELTKYGLPSARTPLIEEINKPAEGDAVDKLIKDNAKMLERLGLPTTRDEWEETLQIEQTVKNWVQGALGGAAAVAEYIMSSLLLLLLTPPITLLILWDYDNFRRRFVTWIPPTIRPATTDILSDMSGVLAMYVRGLAKSVSLYTLVMMFVLSIIGVPYSVFVALLCGSFYLIPYVGNFISLGIIWIAVGTSGKTGFPFLDLGTTTSFTIACLVVFLVVGLLYDQLIHPRIVGKAVGLHPVVSFFVVLCGGAIFGLPGMILAFPVAGMVKVILDRLIRYTTTREGMLDLPRVPSRHL